MQKIINLASFCKTEACCQTVLPDMSISKGQKIVQKSPKSNIYLGESFFDQIMFILFWFGLMVGSILHVIRNGPEYVNQPLLVQTLIRDK